jgi:hypothetical protein
MALKSLRVGRLAGAALCALLFCTGLVHPASGGESSDDSGLFGKPPPAPGPTPPRKVPEKVVEPVVPPERQPLPPEDQDGERRAAGHRRWQLSLDFDYRRRKIRPVKVADKYDDFVGDVHFDKNLSMSRYDSQDIFQTATLGLTLHWRPTEKLGFYAGLRRPLYGKSQHRDIEYDGAPIASPRLDLEDGLSLELAAGVQWEFLRVAEGPLRNFGLSLAGEARFGWGDHVKSPNEDTEFDLNDDDDVEYEAKWQAIDLEFRVFRFFPYTREGGLTAFAGVGGSFFFYHEVWDGEFENGDEKERMEFDYREQNIFFGSVGLRAEKDRFTAEVSGRYGGEYLLHVGVGWKF